MKKLTAPRFAVSVNGQQRCIAGIDGYGVLTASISFVRSKEVQRARSVLLDGVASLHVGGLESHKQVDWLTDDLFVGDEVRIRLLEGGPFEPLSEGVRGVPRGETRQRLESRRDRLDAIGNVIPHRFQVLGNSEPFCTAGVEFGVLNVTCTWVRRNPAARPGHSSKSPEEWEHGHTDLHVGGLEDDVHLEWYRVYVDVDDEIAVRVLGQGPVDPPESRKERRHFPHEEKAVVSTCRMTLRKLVDDDLEFVAQLLGNPQAVAHVQPPLSRDESKQWLGRHIEYRPRRRGMWLIIDNESLQPVGLAGILQVQVEDQALPILQCVISPLHRRKKLGTESTWTCIHMVHRPSGWTGLQPSDAYALVRPENQAGLALANKLGMKSLRTVQHEGHDHMLFVAEDRGH